jgi:hypothetical protein
MGQALQATRPLADLVDTLPPWPGSEVGFTRGFHERLGFWSRLITLEWRLGDTTEARRNAEIFCRWGARRGDCSHPCLWLVDGLEKAGENALSRHLLDEALGGLPDGGSGGGEMSNELVGRLAELDTSAAIQLLTEGASDSSADMRLAKLASHLRDTRVAWSLLGHIHGTEARELFLRNLAYERSREWDWVTARAAVDSLPESHYFKPRVLAMIAVAQERAGEIALAECTIDEVLGFFSTGKGVVYRGDTVLEMSACTLARMGRFERAESLLTTLPEGAKQSVLPEMAGFLERSGLPDSALVVLQRARTANQRDSDAALIRWIMAAAARGNDDLALRASAELQHDFNRGLVHADIAKILAHHGRIKEATRTIGLIEDCPDGLAGAIVAVAIALADSGRLDESLDLVYRIPAAIEEQCHGPGDRAADSSGGVEPCPRAGLVERSRFGALYGIASTRAGRSSTDRLVEGLSPFDAADIFTAAAAAFLDQ